MALLTALPAQTPAQLAEPLPQEAGRLTVPRTLPGSARSAPILWGVLSLLCLSSCPPVTLSLQEVGSHAP